MRDVEAEAGAAVAGPAEPLELLEQERLLLLGQALALVGDRDPRTPVVALDADPYLRIRRRVTDGIAQKVEQDLQHAAELADRGGALAGLGCIDRDAALARTDAEDAGGTAGDVGEVDTVGRRGELLVLDHFEVGEV